MATKTCACGVEIGHSAKRCRRCRTKAATARYERTAKGHATRSKYRKSAAGRALRAICNRRRLFLGGIYRGSVPSALADVINAHIKERQRGFEQRQQARAQAEGCEAGTVSTATDH
jgi:hypothetical protein